MRVCTHTQTHTHTLLWFIKPFILVFASIAATLPCVALLVHLNIFLLALSSFVFNHLSYKNFIQ